VTERRNVFEDLAAIMAQELGVTPDPLAEKRRRIQRLAEEGATEGERAAARSALRRLGGASHAESDAMRRAGATIEDDDYIPL